MHIPRLTLDTCSFDVSPIQKEDLAGGQLGVQFHPTWTSNSLTDCSWADALLATRNASSLHLCMTSNGSNLWRTESNT